MSGVRARGREDSRGTVYGADRVHIPDRGRGGRRGLLHAARGRLRRVRPDERRVRDRRLHTPARHAAAAGHADQEQEDAGKLGQLADHGLRALGRRAKGHAEKSQLSQRPVTNPYNMPFYTRACCV